MSVQDQLLRLADAEAKILQKKENRLVVRGIVSTQVRGLAIATGKIIDKLVKKINEGGL